eukprot:846842-Prymnesium_polylepis.2
MQVPGAAVGSNGGWACGRGTHRGTAEAVERGGRDGAGEGGEEWERPPDQGERLCDRRGDRLRAAKPGRELVDCRERARAGGEDWEAGNVADGATEQARRAVDGVGELRGP